MAKWKKSWVFYYNFKSISNLQKNLKLSLLVAMYECTTLISTSPDLGLSLFFSKNEMWPHICFDDDSLSRMLYFISPLICGFTFILQGIGTSLVGPIKLQASTLRGVGSTSGSGTKILQAKRTKQRGR